MPHIKLDILPDLLALHASQPQRFPVLLQSSGTSGWDMLLVSEGYLRVFPVGEADLVFPALEQQWRAEGAQLRHEEDAHLPFRGGWFAYFGYDLASKIEPSVPMNRASHAFPIAALGRSPAAILVDRGRQQAWAVAEQESRHWLVELAGAVAAQAKFSAHPVEVMGIEEEAPALFLAGVSRIKRYIVEGDVFQVNLSREWQASLGADVQASDVYACLRQANPAPFSALADFGAAQIVSSSPERLLRVHNGQVETRPIAGTHPRSTEPAEDAALKARLISSIKERAEHIMLIDLERNDLGRICLPGTVKVEELMAVCSYAFVHHIESSVVGRLRQGVAPVEVLRALFPGGTITGCPKVRTMQIINELESGPRRAYTGSLGYLNRDGSMDFNILIRTFMYQGQKLRFRAGAGIVADSEPELELNETRAKARGLLRALGAGQ